MIVVDTSAIVAILVLEPDAALFASAMDTADRLAISTATALELSLVCRTKLDPPGWERARQFMAEARIETAVFDAPQMEIAIRAHASYGRGSGHPARLNFGDCFSYALAKSLDAPLLYKGDDFVHTDIRSAIRP